MGIVLKSQDVNALSLGITPNIVMKWTGHSDYKAMKPYIDIVDYIKASSMTKFDGLIYRTRSKKCVIEAKTRWKKCRAGDFSCPYLSE